MDDRAFRVSIAHINAMVETKTDKDGPLDEARVKEVAQNALKSYYPTFLHTYLRNLEVTDIITLMFFITKQFGATEPLSSLKKTLTPFKIKILNAIGDAAMLDKGSLLDKTTTYFRENPADSESDIEQYVQRILSEIKNNTKRTAPKLERIVSQY
jgi:hypothetical protein